MTHSYEQDRAALSALLPIAPRYLGMLGARHRSALLLSEAAQVANLPVATCCERVWAPVGLDLGGDGPEHFLMDRRFPSREPGEEEQLFLDVWGE